MAYISVSHTQTLIRLALYQWTVGVWAFRKNKKNTIWTGFKCAWFSPSGSSWAEGSWTAFKGTVYLEKFFAAQGRQCSRPVPLQQTLPQRDAGIHLAGFDELLEPRCCLGKVTKAPRLLWGVNTRTTIAQDKCNLSHPCGVFRSSARERVKQRHNLCFKNCSNHVYFINDSSAFCQGVINHLWQVSLYS